MSVAQVEHTIAGSHSAGLADLDARADLLATCGYTARHGQIVPDLYVKVRCSAPKQAVLRMWDMLCWAQKLLPHRLLGA